MSNVDIVMFALKFTIAWIVFFVVVHACLWFYDWIQEVGEENGE